MKRLIAVGLALAVVLGGVFIYLRSTAITPELYTGEWYRVEDGKQYRFHQGIISPVDAQGEFAGAYVFCAEKILLFIKEPAGNSRVCELYPGGVPKGEFLRSCLTARWRCCISKEKVLPRNPYLKMYFNILFISIPWLIKQKLAA